MARGFLSVLNQMAREAERSARKRQRESERYEVQLYRETERAQKARERTRQQEARAQETEQKRQSVEAKAAHVEAREAEAEALNAELEERYEAIDGLLAATLEVDDYFDITSLRREPDPLPFEHAHLEKPSPRPIAISDPPEPAYVEPPPPKALFGKEKKHKAAISAAQAAHAQAVDDWQTALKEMQARRQALNDKYEREEKDRLHKLKMAKAAHAEACAQQEREVAEYNEAIDSLIANLGYGTADAIEAYISIVFSNSLYPDHFPVSHALKFEPSSAELRLRVSIPAPSEVESVKNFRYVKKNDEIISTELSQKARKDRYTSALDQVALRSIHEVFEADRRGLIKTVSVEVGTEAADPATGVHKFITLAAVAAEKGAFLEFDLSALVPRVTMQHLGAALSKDPYGLIAVDTSGVRRA